MEPHVIVMFFTFQTFTGNSDNDAIVENPFPHVLHTTAVRLVPIAFNGFITTRADLIGC